jgi:peptidoglycan/xylan/chitin deacetylase (PgdA/CDA1 family)
MNRVYKAFKDGKHKCLTLSYDDGKIEDYRLLELFKKYNIKATFNLNSSIKDSKHIPQNEWRELYKDHEVAVHTMTHPTMERCSTYQICEELIEDKNNLEHIMGRPVRGLAFPNGSYNEEIINMAKSLGFKYARVAGDKYANICSAKFFAKEAEGPILLGDETGFGMPQDFMHWLPTCHHNHHLVSLGKDFTELSKKQYLYMMYVWGHSFEFERNNNWEVMEEFCKIISNRDDIWYATNIEVVEYDEAFKNLQFFDRNEYVYNPSAQSVWVVINNEKIVELKGGTTTKLS